jgi:ferredoxin-nitrite reductase
VYGDGTARLTCEENILFVNVPNEKLPAMLAEPIFTRFKVNPGACVSSRARARA